MTVEYSQVDYLRLHQPPHHTRSRPDPFVVEADGYPPASEAKPGKPAIFRWGPTDADGRREKQHLGLWRGIDKSVGLAVIAKYKGEDLRRLRAIKGVGR